jgi:hypothetical protein
MLKRVVIGVSLAWLMGGAAYAADEPPPTAAPAEGDDQCSQQLATTEAAVQSKVEANALSEADTDKVNELLDQADAQCTEGDLAGATKTLGGVSAMLAKTK